MGMGTNEEVLRLFYGSSKMKIAGAGPKELKRLIGRRTIADIINMETGEVMLDAGSKINEDNISILREMKVKEVDVIEFPKGKDNPVLINCLEKDGVNDYEDAIKNFTQLCVRANRLRLKMRSPS